MKHTTISSCIKYYVDVLQKPKQFTVYEIKQAAKYTVLKYDVVPVLAQCFKYSLVLRQYNRLRVTVTVRARISLHLRLFSNTKFALSYSGTKMQSLLSRDD